MKAVLFDKPGGAEMLYLGEVPEPQIGEEELLVRVRATALNRADILQRMGKYPPPPGASSILGLELAGEVVQVGSACQSWKVGDRVMGIVAGGSYAELATIPCQTAMKIPEKLSFEEAAAIPEAFLTAFQVLHWIAHLQPGEYVLIHAGASGVGTAAIQLVKLAGAHPLVTVGSPEKAEFCRRLGAEVAIEYRTESFPEKVLAHTAQHGADIIIDCVGAPYWPLNFKCLAMDGRIVYIATLGGSRLKDVDLRDLFKKRAQITASTLRGRELPYKIALTRDFSEKVLPHFEQGRLRPVIDRIFSWKQVQEAHRYMEENRNMGKIILRID